MAVKRYNGTSWDTVAGLGAQGAAATSSSITTWVKTATGGETSLTGSSDSSTTLAYTPGQEQLFINGVLQVRGSDYTATNGTSITGLAALVAGDIATVTTVNAFSVTGAVPLSTVTANGDLIVGTSSGAVGRLGVGSTSQVLTVSGGVPTWATPTASASGLTLISTQTVSNVATITFDNVFTSTYANYLVVFDDIFNETTSSADMLFQFRYAGPTTQTSHTYAMNGTNSASAVITTGAASQTSALLSRNMGQSTYRLSGQIFVSGVGNASRLAMGRGQTADTWGEEILNYFFYGTTARTYTGFIISTSTGNLNGTFTVYGLAKS